MLHKKDVNPIDTDASVSLALKQISNAFVKDANRTLKRIGLTVSQAEILLFLYHTRIQEVSQRDIESHFGLQHPTVIGLLERLRKKGFVQCAVNSEDRRCRTVSLTEKAYEIQQEMELRRKKMEQHLLRDIPDTHLTLLLETLNQMLVNISEEDPAETTLNIGDDR